MSKLTWIKFAQLRCLNIYIPSWQIQGNQRALKIETYFFGACLVPATSSGISWKKNYSERFLSNTCGIKWKNKIKKWIFFFHQFGGRYFLPEEHHKTHHTFIYLLLSLQFDLFLSFPKKSLPNTNSKFWKKVEEDFF
jgi:hypothetical protein